MSNLTINPFDLLGEDGGRRRRAQAAPKQPTTPAPAPVAKPAAAPASKPAGQQQAGQQKASTAKAAPLNNNAGPRNQNGAPRAPRPQGANGDNQKGRVDNRKPPQQAGGAAAPARREDLPAGEKRFNPNKGERRERPPVNRGRQFDRKSGTGRPPTENKKGGSGKGNWGKEDGTEDPIKETGEVEKEETEKVASTEEAAAVADEPQAPKEPETKSLDEYLAERKQKAAKVDAFKKREAGEGVDQSAWNEYVPLNKDEDAVDLPLKGKKKESKKEVAATEKVELDTNFRFAPIQGDREDRGGRRGGRGGERRPSGDRKPRGDNNNRRGGRGAGRGAAPATPGADSAQINIADFPALGGAAAKPAATPAAAPAPVKA